MLPRLRHLSRRDAVAITFCSAAVSVIALALLVGMGFQPGWAHGWPFPKELMFATFVTAIFGVVSVSATSIPAIWLCYFSQQMTKRSASGWVAFLVVFVLACGCVILACPHVFTAVHAEIARNWH